MKTFLTADWHIGEERFELMQRPFRAVAEYIDALVAHHNAAVAPDDLVYVNGDVLYQKASPEEFLPHVARFHGRKILLRGNHDRPFTDAQFAPYFERIVVEGEGIDVTIAGVPCFITHYHSLAREDRFNLVGHIHGAWKFQLNSLNVGVDVHHFRPVAEEQIPFFLKAIESFYDLDVWTAYQSANQAHFATRGKKSTYFEPKGSTPASLPPS